jgi:hypothetical protein
VSTDSIQNLLIGCLIALYFIGRVGTRHKKGGRCDCPPCAARRESVAEIAAINKRYDRLFVEKSKKR